MPVFSKTVLKPGVFYVNTHMPDGKVVRKKEVITRERIKHWVDQFHGMRKVGLSIPAPTFHDLKAVPQTDEQRNALAAAQADAAANPGSFRNAGWWDNLTQADDGKLHGLIDVPVAADAERIGKTIKEVSIHTRPEYTDGNGKVWKDVIHHIALVNHPVEPGQDNFVPVNLPSPNQDTPSEPVTAIAMSDFVEDVPPEGSISMADESGNPKLVNLSIEEYPASGETNVNFRFKSTPNSVDMLAKLKSMVARLEKGDDVFLRQSAILMSDASDETPAPNVGKAVAVLKKLGICLTEGTTADNIIDRIITAGEALIASQEATNKDPDGSGDGKTSPKKVPGAIYMSETKTYTPVDVNTPAGKMAVRQLGKDIALRASALVNSGRIPASYFDETLKPMIEGLSMSVVMDEEGNLGPTPLEPVLQALEKLPRMAGVSGAPNVDAEKKEVTVGSIAMSLIDVPDYAKHVVTPADTAETLAAFYKNIGVTPAPSA